MDGHNYDIRFPENVYSLDQNEEYIVLNADQSTERVLLHDYQRFYEIPGLYEEVLYNQLKCCSPRVISRLLSKAMLNRKNDHQALRVLDFGAGNGVAGEQLKNDLACETLVGVDILPEAKEAALRDRPNLYDDYLVLNFCDLSDEDHENLAEFDFNTLVSIAALGYDHIGTQAFLNAFELLPEGAWVAFNIKDRFLSEDDTTGFKETIDDLMNDRLEVLEHRQYVHRMSIKQEPLYYVGIAGRVGTAA